MDKKKVEIPTHCISICKTDPLTGFCYGCARTNEEKQIWKKNDISIEWKKKNLSILLSRMSGWQLKTFEESYKHKINFGISIYKKNLDKKP